MLACVIATIVHQAQSQIFGVGSCPDTSKAVPVSLLDQFNGPLNVIYSMFNVFEAGNICSKADIKLHLDGKSITKSIKGIKHGWEREVSGTATANDDSTGGSFVINSLYGHKCLYLISVKPTSVVIA